MSKTKKICLTALGIALYVCVSMLIKIPVVGHISLDLGYIVLAVYCYIYGGVSGAIVGSCGCFLVSLIASGWIAIGWPLGNFLIGALCGAVYARTKGKSGATLINTAVTVAAVFVGVAVIKTVVECALYSLPVAAKFAKNLVAFSMDASSPREKSTHPSIPEMNLPFCTILHLISTSRQICRLLMSVHQAAYQD